MKKGNILVVDDNESILESLKQLLKYDFQKIKTLNNPNLILSEIAADTYDVILLDMNYAAGMMTGNEGIFWLKEILKVDPLAVVILITAYGDIELAVKAIKEGGTDFIVKPWDPEKLLATTQSAYQLRKSRMEVKNLKRSQKLLHEEINRQFDPVLGSSPKMLEVLKTVHKVAASDANILITGENGTGKELIAREIHRLSHRADKDFVSVDMGALSESLFESEMFGHVRGAFTDAKGDRTGRFEIASEGTLFLDEIGNLNMNLQAKLLQALENKSIIPVGSNSRVSVDIRLISATNQDLEKMITCNLFREDLFYRINTIRIDLPPLRDRAEDIPVLLDHFLKKYEKKYQKPSFRINGEAYENLTSYDWPGNIRELKHTVERAVVLSNSNILNPEDFFINKSALNNSRNTDYLKLADMEKNSIEQALSIAQGNISHAARILDITRTTLYSKMHKYGL